MCVELCTFCSLSSRTTSGSPPSSHTCNGAHVQRHFLKRQLRTVRRYERGCDWLAVNSAFPPQSSPSQLLLAVAGLDIYHIAAVCFHGSQRGGLHAWFNRGAADLPPPHNPPPTTPLNVVCSFQFSMTSS